MLSCKISDEMFHDDSGEEERGNEEERGLMLNYESADM